MNIYFQQPLQLIFLKTVRNKRNPVQGLNNDILDKLSRIANENSAFSLGKLFAVLSELCETAEKPIVLIIDEVDSAANNQVFWIFLHSCAVIILTGRTVLLLVRYSCRSI